MVRELCNWNVKNRLINDTKRMNPLFFFIDDQCISIYDDE
jgi:hypothetical protein